MVPLRSDKARAGVVARRTPCGKECPQHDQHRPRPSRPETPESRHRLSPLRIPQCVSPFLPLSVAGPAPGVILVAVAPEAGPGVHPPVQLVQHDVVAPMRQRQVGAVPHPRAGLQFLFPGVAPLAERGAVARLAQVLPLPAVQPVVPDKRGGMTEGGVGLERPGGDVGMAFAAVDLRPPRKVLRMLRRHGRRLRDGGAPREQHGQERPDDDPWKRASHGFSHPYLPWPCRAFRLASGRIFSWTRRFAWRPSGVELSATGASSPYPRMLSRRTWTPSFTRMSKTFRARFSLSVWLDCADPVESVWPSIVASVSGYRFRISATAASVRRAGAFTASFPTSKTRSDGSVRSSISPFRAARAAGIFALMSAAIRSRVAATGSAAGVFAFSSGGLTGITGTGIGAGAGTGCGGAAGAGAGGGAGAGVGALGWGAAAAVPASFPASFCCLPPPSVDVPRSRETRTSPA